MLRVENLSFAFERGKSALRNISFDVHEGQILGIIGLNGSGKSTLLKLLQRIYVPQTGNIFICGKNLQSYSGVELAKKVASVPQRFFAAFDFTVRQFVMLGRTPYLHFLQRPSAADESAVQEALQKCDCLRLADFSILRLSAGEFQRVSIAMALAQEPRLLLLDEPTSSLDLRQRSRLSRLLADLQKSGITILCASHDMPFLRIHAEKILLLHGGMQMAFAPAEEVFASDYLQDLFEMREEIYAR